MHAIKTCLLGEFMRKVGTAFMLIIVSWEVNDLQLWKISSVPELKNR